MKDFMLNLEIQELVCKIIEEVGDDGIDTENDMRLYRAVQALAPYGNIENEVDKALTYLQKENFIKIVQNSQGRTVHLLKDKTLTLAKIQEYFD